MNLSRTINESKSLTFDQPILPTPNERWRSGMIVLPDVMIERELGWGGMGVVYLATQRITGHSFALKRVAAAQFAPKDVRKRLFRELTAWLNLPPHPHIIPCLFFRTLETGEIVIFSPFINGGTLEEWISNEDARPLQVVLDIGLQIVDGLVAVHSYGMVHRDLKPANVLMSTDGVAGITDFGLASVLDSKRQCGLTLAYASPEQMENAEITFATDVFSWAATMAHALLGARTWSDSRELSAAWNSLAAAAGVLDGVSTLIANCLEHDPSCRPTSIEVANRLRQLARKEFGAVRSAVVTSTANEPSTIHRFQLESAGAFGRMMIGPIYWHLKARTLDLEVGDFDDAELKTTRANLAQDITELSTLAELFKAAAGQRSDVRPWCVRLLVEFSLALVEAGDFNGANQAALEAVEMCAQTSDITPEDHASAHLARARALITAGRRDEALRELEGLPTLLENRDMVASALINIANLQADLSRLDLAIETYEQARTLLCKHTPGFMREFELARINGELALLYRRANDLDGAFRSIDAALAVFEQLVGEIETISVQYGFALYLKGTILADMQRHQEAIACYDRAMETLSSAPAELHLEPEIESARMSRALSLCQIDRRDEAISDLDRVIAKRKELVEERGLIDYSVDLARAYTNKARVLAENGDFKGQVETKLKAYALLSELNNKFQRKDIRPELYALAGSLGEDFATLGDREFARQLLGASMAVLELVCQDAAIEAKDLLPTYQADLVTKYYQVSFLCDGDDKKLAEVKEYLLDRCLNLAFLLMENGADAEVCDRVVSALTDKALLMSERSDEKASAQELLQQAEEMGASLIRSSPIWSKYAISFLRAANVRAGLLMETNPREACKIFSAALAEIDGKASSTFEPELADRVAMTWIAKARAQRGLEDIEEVVRSYSRGSALWEEAIARKHYYSTQAYSQFACDHAYWLIDHKQFSFACKVVKSMIDTCERVAQETGSREAHAAVAHYKSTFRSVIDLC